MKISKLLNKKYFSIILILCFGMSVSAEDKPIEVLPDPIIPKKTIFLPDSITFFIEKTQICLILKLSKFICNLLKKQVQAEVLLG